MQPPARRQETQLHTITSSLALQSQTQLISRRQRVEPERQGCVKARGATVSGYYRCLFFLTSQGISVSRRHP